ncbi:MAG: HlyD family efflux transporter periplasmic adaptor subunit [Algicola sp.]|nr:HlyD family efflux transporter periplasmic adaptor subunit [Algicola sp.]
MALAAPAVCQAGLLLTGQVASKNSETFYAPRISGWQTQVEWMLPEGKIAKIGELVVLFDRASVDADIEMKESDLSKKKDQLALAKSTGEEGIMDAEFAFEKAKLEHQKSQIDADIGIEFVSSYEHEKANVELEKKRLDVEKARRRLTTKREEVKTDIEKKQTAIKKTDYELNALQRKSALTALKSKMGGPMVYANHPWNGSKITSGSTVQATWKVAEIASTTEMRIVAWLNEVDKGSVTTDSKVVISVDAMTGKQFEGVVTKLVPQSEAKEAWGTAAFFQIEIDIKDYSGVALVPGMSVLVEVL